MLSLVQNYLVVEYAGKGKGQQPCDNQLSYVVVPEYII